MQFPDYTIYQSHCWGDHKSRFGWIPHRMKATKGDRIVAAAQVLVRRFPFGIAVAWVPGGPVGLVESWGRPFRSAVEDALGARHLYCRVYPLRERVRQDQEQMVAAGWQRTQWSMNSGTSLAYALTGSEDDRMGRASGNWRHNLRRSRKYAHAVGVWETPDPEQLLQVYKAMQSHKGLQEQISRAALVSILAAFGKKCIVVRCNDEQGHLLALRGALLLGSKGWDIFAAATPRARKVYASYATFWELMKQCASRKVLSYDMSGVDPVAGKGVYDFKKGTGASELEYLGEWDWATSSIIQRTANWLIRRRAQVI